jgi:hypothetical protein
LAVAPVAVSTTVYTLPLPSWHLRVWLLASAQQLVPVIPPCTDQVLVAVQAYKFVPADAFVLKNICPTTHADGKVVPVWSGFVELAPEKSTRFAWVTRSICVCAVAVSPIRAITSNLCMTPLPI